MAINQCWGDKATSEIEVRLDGFRDERDDDAWREMIALSDEELDIVRKGLHAFGYVFYVMERAD